MAQQQDSGNKTEKATPKSLRDARKRGEIPKSKEITSTLGLAFTMVLFWLAFADSAERLAGLLIDVITLHDNPFDETLMTLGGSALKTLLILSGLVLLPVAGFGMLVEYLQTGPIFAMEKVKPKMSNLDPVQGVKRMFSMDNFVEVIKSIVKTALLFLIGYLVIRSLLHQIVLLPDSEPGTLVSAVFALAIRLFGWTLGLFLLVTALDLSYQHYSFAKRMRMSMRDIRQEHKDSEGDPQMKGQRTQLHKEWAQEGATQAAGDATVLLVNPTHVAIAITYDKETTPIPMVTAKGEYDTARAMRDAANEAHVPVLRNELLARTLLADVDEGDFVPRELFDVVAGVILWATQTRALISQQQHGPLHSDTPPPGDPPGEDLTSYPDDMFAPTTDSTHSDTADSRINPTSEITDEHSGIFS